MRQKKSPELRLRNKYNCVPIGLAGFTDDQYVAVVAPACQLAGYEANTPEFDVDSNGIKPDEEGGGGGGSVGGGGVEEELQLVMRGR